MRLTLIHGSLVLASLLVGAGMLWSQRGAPQAANATRTMASPTSESASDVRRLEGEVRKLRRALGKLEAAPGVAAVARQDAPAPVAEAEPEVEVAGEGESEATQEARSFERRNALGERLATEPRDDSWSQAYEDRLVSLFKTLEHQRVLGVNCAQSLCQVRFAEAPPGTLDELADYVRTSFAAESYGYPSEDGTFVVYIAREGHSLGS